MKELIQSAQVIARQNGRPSPSVLNLLPDGTGQEPIDSVISPFTFEEHLVIDLVNLALTIRDDGQVNLLT
jgi:hypothetical protein